MSSVWGAGRQRLADRLDLAAFGTLILLAAGLAFERVTPLLQLPGLLAISTVEATLLLAVAFWLLSKIAAGRWPSPPPKASLPAAAWLLALVASALVAPALRVDAFKFLTRIINGLLVGWVAYDLTTSNRRWQALVKALAVGGIAVTLLGLAEMAGIDPVVGFLAGFKGSPTYVGDVLRLSSTLSYTTTAAMILELTLPLVLVWAVTATRPWSRWLLASLLLLGLIAVALTLARSGIVGLAAAWILLAVVSWRRRWRRLALGAVGAIVAMTAITALILIANPVVRLRLNSESQSQWYGASYDAPGLVLAQAGQDIVIPVTVTNVGVRTWETIGDNPFSLGYHLLDEAGNLLSFEGHHTLLQEEVAPKDTVTIQAVVPAPPQPGDYLLEWDMVHEQVTWFGGMNEDRAYSRLVVSVPGTEPEPDLGQPVTDPPTATTNPRATDVVPPVGRLQLWRTALSMTRDRPLLGVGPDNFRWLYGAYAGVDRWDTRVHANNLYLEWLADTGLVGLTLFLWLNGAIVLAAYRNVSIHAGSRGPWHLTLLASLATWYLHGLLDSFYEFTPTYVAFWLIAGLALRSVDIDHQGQA